MSEAPARARRAESRGRFRAVDFRVIQMTQATRIDTETWPQWVQDAYDSQDANGWRLTPAKLGSDVDWQTMELNIIGPNGTTRVYHGWYIVKGSTGELFAMSPETYAALMRDV